jgi:uncharacterized membrane protein
MTSSRRHSAVSALLAGTLIMITGALIGAILYQSSLETLSLVLGGVGFLFGAMWFGSGLKQLRDKQDVSDRG